MSPQIHLIDETWVDAPPPTVAAAVADPENWRAWWPKLDLTVTRDRGVKGIQWAACSSADSGRRLAGSVELWLEPFSAGVIVHHFIRLDPIDGRELPRRTVLRETRRLAWHAKQVFWRLKDDLEESRR